MKWFTSAPCARHRKNDQTANKTCLHGVNWGQFCLYFELLLIINFIAPQPTSSVWEQYSAVTVLPHPCIQVTRNCVHKYCPTIKRRYLASLLTPRLCKALRAHWPSPAMILFRTSTVSTRNVFVTIYNPTRVNHTSGHIRVACPKDPSPCRRSWKISVWFAILFHEPSHWSSPRSACASGSALTSPQQKPEWMRAPTSRWRRAKGHKMTQTGHKGLAHVHMEPPSQPTSNSCCPPRLAHCHWIGDWLIP